MDAIRVEGLTKRYGDHTAVDGIGFVVEQGEAFGILGPNGAGKTTTLEMIEGLRRPDGGRGELLELFARFYDRADGVERAKEALRLVGLESKADAYAGDMSGGQQQRLAI